MEFVHYAVIAALVLGLCVGSLIAQRFWNPLPLAFKYLNMFDWDSDTPPLEIDNGDEPPLKTRHKRNCITWFSDNHFLDVHKNWAWEKLKHENLTTEDPSSPIERWEIIGYILAQGRYEELTIKVTFHRDWGRAINIELIRSNRMHGINLIYDARRNDGLQELFIRIARAIRETKAQSSSAAA